MSVKFAIDSVPGDGDCFYHAFIKGLQLDTTPKSLREYVVGVLKTDSDLFDDLKTELKDYRIIRGDEKIDEIAMRIVDYKEWATSTVIHILACAFNVKVIVFQKIKDNYFGESFPSAWKPCKNANVSSSKEKVIYILQRGNHFDLLHKMSADAIECKSMSKNVKDKFATRLHRGGGKRNGVVPCVFGVMSIFALFCSF